MNNKTIDRIEDYIRGDMNETEANEFRRELEQNSELAEYYRTLNAFNEQLIKEDRNKTKERIKQIFNEYIEENYPDPKKKDPIIKHPYTRWIAAAAIIAMALAVYFILVTRQKSLPSELYKRHFAHFNHTIQPRDAGDSISSFYYAMQLYKAGSFQDALNSFLVSQNKHKQISEFYIGLCYLELNKYLDAIKHLEKAVNLNSEYQEDAEWYLALAYLADGNVNKTEGIIEQITKTPKHYYYEQAQNLLADLK